jgi:hypothetical protein
MSNDALTQSEAQMLSAMEKISQNNTEYVFPDLGGNVEIPLISRDGREFFSLDISRKRIALTTKFQTRARQSLVLARLDFNSPHRNPDDTEVGVPHLHLYCEGYGDKYAYEIPSGMLSKPTDVQQTLQDFMRYCTIVSPPNIKWGLFS